MLLKTIDTYRANLRNAVRALWSGEWDYFTFYDQMMLSTERGFTQAWHEGAKMYGVNPSELTEAEHNALRAEVVKETNFIDAFAQAILARNKRSGGKLEPQYARAELWVAAYSRIVTLASVHAARDAKLEYVLGRSREHCVDCVNYNGRVYRASVWRKYDIQPRSFKLACRGYNCQCEFVQTNKPCTPGFPPAPRGR